MSYSEWSKDFQKTGNLFLSFLKERRYFNKDEDEWLEEGKKKTIQEYLKKKLSFLGEFFEYRKGWNLLKEIHVESSKLFKRCGWFCDENIENQKKYDNPESANSITRRNIFEIESILKSHEFNKENKCYNGMIELRNIQNVFDLYIQAAKQLNYYLKKENGKAVQLRHGKLMLIYLDNGELNVEYKK